MRPKRILLVEDDGNKLNQLSQFLHVEFANSEIAVAQSVNSAKAALSISIPDLVILDMTLPNFDLGPHERGGETRKLGGRDVLRQIDRRRIAVPVIVITQFESFSKNFQIIALPQLDQQLRNAHPNSYRGAIYYHASIDTWKGELLKLIRDFFGEHKDA